MTDETKPNLRRVKTTPFRMSFPFILEPRLDKKTKQPSKYELNLLFPPGLDRKPFMAAFLDGAIEKWGKDKSKWPRLTHKPDACFIDFAAFNAESKKPLPGDWTGWTLMRARATLKNPPGVVGATRDAGGKFPVIRDAREVYSGRWARAVLEAYAYDRDDGKGVTLALINVQLLKHDTRFGGAVTAPESDFSDDVAPEWAGEADDFDQGAAPQGGAGTKAAAASDDDWN